MKLFELFSKTVEVLNDLSNDVPIIELYEERHVSPKALGSMLGRTCSWTTRLLIG